MVDSSAHAADIAAAAAAIGDHSRTRVLLALSGGRVLPASGLAAEAGVSASTISGHLSKLLSAGLVTVDGRGRHRYYRVAGPEVADAIDAIARISRGQVPPPERRGRSRALRQARTCYDHVGGQLGIAIMAALLRADLLAETRGDADRPATYRLTEAGSRAFAGLGIDPAELSRRRPAVRTCMDWSEQRQHLSGALGAALAGRMFDLGWVTHGPSRRVISLTERGRDGLRDHFDIAEW